MAEVIRVRAAERSAARVFGMATPEAYSRGVYKASDIDALTTGIIAREHELVRVKNAAEWNKAVATAFEAWCRDKGLTINHGVLGVIREVARIANRLGVKHADDLVATAVSAPYQGFWNEYKEMLISGYREVRV